MDIQSISNLPPTIRLYNQTPYAQEATATVLYSEDNIAIFDKTIFYAESGGQVSDLGWVGDNVVIDVQKRLGEFHSVKNKNISVPTVKINTRIIHTFANPVNFHVGDIVEMKINWERRYKIMKHHTLSHFLFHAIDNFFKENNFDMFLKGCAIDEEKATFSLNNAISEEQFEQIKRSVECTFDHNIPIYMHPEETTDEIFYWTANDIVIPCGGTHIVSTREIDTEFYIGKKSGGKNKTKLYIKLIA
ncbi:alanyl-tRNA editing protein [Dickeya zeae]|nr:alanyl-tRNA editing protein [Dickeya zeae]